MRTLLRQDFKRLLYKNKEFRIVFPEYTYLFIQLDTGKIKRSCCGFSENLYNQCIQLVLANIDKWKNFLNTDKIQMYYSKNGNPKKSYIL